MSRKLKRDERFEIEDQLHDDFGYSAEETKDLEDYEIENLLEHHLSKDALDDFYHALIYGNADYDWPEGHD